MRRRIGRRFIAATVLAEDRGRGDEPELRVRDRLCALRSGGSNHELTAIHSFNLRREASVPPFVGVLQPNQAVPDCMEMEEPREIGHPTTTEGVPGSDN